MEPENCIRVHYNMDPSNSRRRRLSDEAIQSEKGEMRGVVILIVCGLYAISMFLLAKLITSILSSVSASVRTMLFSVTKHELKMAPPTAAPHQTNVVPFMRKSFKTRPTYHG